MKLETRATEIKFVHGVMKNRGLGQTGCIGNGTWALFTIEPVNQPGYVWWITKSDNFPNGFTLIPLWKKGNWKRVQWLSFEECLKLALENEEFVANSEQF